MKWTFKLGKIVTFYAYPLSGVAFDDSVQLRGQVIRNQLIQTRGGEEEVVTVRWFYPEGEYDHGDVNAAELTAVDDGLEDGG